MAEFVQQSVEEMVGELHEMRSTGLFDASELRYHLGKHSTITVHSAFITVRFIDDVYHI